MRSLSEVFKSWWDEVCLSINGALLYLDDPAAECLHWHGGLMRALKDGAAGVRNFSTFEKASPTYKKAVFVVAAPMTEDMLRTLMVLIQSNSFRSCTLISSSPISGSEGSKSECDSLLLNLEAQMLSWMGNMNYAAEVLHVPVCAFSLMQDIFVIPSISRHIQSVIPEFFFPDLIKKRESGLLFLPDGVQKSIKMLSSFLSTLLENLQLKGDIFSLGSLSHVVGTELENLCHVNRKKGYTNKASVLLIDRSLDLAGPLSQSTDTPFGKMLRLMPHLPGHVCDVCINMSDLAHSLGDTAFGLPLLAPGCIGHRNNSAENDCLNALLRSRTKESLMEMNRKIVQTSVKDGLSVEAASTTVAKNLRRQILSYREKPQLLHRNSGLLQQALGIVQMMEHPLSSHLDDLLATEKLLVQNFSHSERIDEDIGRLITNRKERCYKMIEVLTLIAFLYALSNDEVMDSDSEASIQATVMEALFQEDADTVELVRKMAGDDANDHDTSTAVKSLFDVFNNFRNHRKNHGKYHSIFDPGDSALPATYVPVLKKILEDIFKSSDMPDVEYHSGGLSDYIKTGFSLFMNVAKPQPKDNPVIFIIVLGGISATEIKLVHDMIAQHRTPKVIVGSTNILTPEGVMEDLFEVVKNMSVPEESVEDYY